MPETDQKKKETPTAAADYASEDSPQGSYYYDDSHGYEDFDPESEEEQK